MDTLQQFQKLRNSLSQERERLVARLKEINRVLGVEGQTTTPAKTSSGMSDAAKAKISAAAKARWAKIKAGKKATAPKAKRTMSAAVKKRISESTKARWARIKAAGKKKL